MRKRILTATLAVSWIFCAAASAQTNPSTNVKAATTAEPSPAPPKEKATFYDSEDFSRTCRAVNLMTAETLRRNALLFLLDHRNMDTFLEDPLENWFGFEGSGLKYGIGIRYGIIEGLEAGFYRLSRTVERFDVYEFDVKYQPLNQKDHVVDLAVRAGGTWFVQYDMDDAFGYFGQFLIDHIFWDRLVLGTGLLFHSDSSNDVKSTEDTEWSLAVQGLAEVRIVSFMAWDIEVAESVAGYGAEWPSFSTALKFFTHRHTFSVVFSNSPYTSADGVVSNSGRGFDDLVLGFQLTREFNF